jgi:HemY protein
MKFGLIVLATLVLCSVAAVFLLTDVGYVIISFRGYLIEMSVPVLLSAVAGLFVAVWLVRRVIAAPRKLGEAAGRYRSGRAELKLTQGMIEVAEGNFARGEKLLARAAKTSDTPLFNYLQAARAAHLQGLDERRDEWLRLAFENNPDIGIDKICGGFGAATADFFLDTATGVKRIRMVLRPYKSIDA